MLNENSRVENVKASRIYNKPELVTFGKIANVTGTVATSGTGRDAAGNGVNGYNKTHA